MEIETNTPKLMLPELKKLATERMTPFKRPLKNKDFEERFELMYHASSSEGNKIQLYFVGDKEKQTTINYFEGINPVEKKVAARFWVINKDGNGKNDTILYTLTQDGVWLSQTSDKMSNDTERETDFWVLNKAKKVDESEIRINVLQRIKGIQKPALISK